MPSIINDTVMGGLSSSSFSRSKDGHLLFSGEVSLKNYGGFASVRSPAIQDSLKGFKGLIINIRGDGNTYKCTIRISSRIDSVLYQLGFETVEGEWEQIRLPFSEFLPTFRGRILNDQPRLDPEKIVTTGFLISDKQEGSFQLEIDWIKAYR